MKYQSYLAVNLADFHQNQKKGEPQTTAEILFIAAKNVEAAKKHVRQFYPDNAWGVIPKKTLDNNIVYYETERNKKPS